MQGVARNFFIMALAYAVAGMSLGLHMSISKDHGQMPTHAHTMVAGWLMSSVFAFFYHLFPAVAAGRLAMVHFWLTTISGVALLLSLFLFLAGHVAIEQLLGAASLAFYAAMFLFIVVALPVVRANGSKLQKT